jgi:hypothetical protein
VLENSQALTVAIVTAKAMQENQIRTHKVCRTVANVSRLEIQDSRAINFLEMQDRKAERTLLLITYFLPNSGHALEDSFAPHVSHHH